MTWAAPLVVGAPFGTHGIFGVFDGMRVPSYSRGALDWGSGAGAPDGVFVGAICVAG